MAGRVGMVARVVRAEMVVKVVMESRNDYYGGCGGGGLDDFDIG